MASFLSLLLVIYVHSGVGGPQTRILWEGLLGRADPYSDLLTGQICVDVDSVNLMWTFVGCEDGRTGGDILSGVDDLWLRISSPDRPLPRSLEPNGPPAARIKKKKKIKKNSVFGIIVLAPVWEVNMGSCQRGGQRSSL